MVQSPHFLSPSPISELRCQHSLGALGPLDKLLRACHAHFNPMSHETSCGWLEIRLRWRGFTQQKQTHTEPCGSFLESVHQHTAAFFPHSLQTRLAFQCFLLRWATSDLRTLALAVLLPEPLPQNFTGPIFLSVGRPHRPLPQSGRP